MLKNTQNDKVNLGKLFTLTHLKVCIKDEFRQVFIKEKTLHSPAKIRSRIMPIIRSNISDIYIKAEMLRRCYGFENNDYLRKKVSFPANGKERTYFGETIQPKKHSKSVMNFQKSSLE